MLSYNLMAWGNFTYVHFITDFCAKLQKKEKEIYDNIKNINYN